jgi:signal transduction histidine kinase
MSEKLRVLLVEDNPGDAYLIERSLERAFALECVPRLATALDRARQDRFDLILLDLGLPDSTGLDTVRAMRKQSGDTPIVVQTGNDDERVGLAAIQAGAQDYVVKGKTDVPILARILRYAMERQQNAQRLREMEAKLLQAQKMEAVGRLAGGVAHEFNNMLNVILGHAELALMKLDPDHAVCADLAEITKAGERSAAVTRQLLAFARKQAIVPKVLALNDIVASMLKMLRRLIGENIELVWQPAANLWSVKMDPSQIDQMVVNLMLNARDAISGVGSVTITTGMAEFDASHCETHSNCRPGCYAMLAVSDNGCGMSKETQARLFEPFFTTKEIGKGTGLGLAMVYGIVQQNYGFITVESEIGKGTKFTIYLPRCAAEVATSQTPKKTDMATGTETVLLVEDEPSILLLGKEILGKLGYTVLAAGSPKQALDIASDYIGTIHLLLTDVVMPEMNGRDLWQRLQALRPDIKCLFMSGYTADAITHYGMLEQGSHFIEKPFSIAAIATKMRHSLSARL